MHSQHLLAGRFVKSEQTAVKTRLPIISFDEKIVDKKYLLYLNIIYNIYL